MARTESTVKSADSSDYRQRFLDALDAQEQLEREAGRRVSALAALLARLTRALALDSNSALTKNLERLSSRLDERPLDPALGREVTAMHGALLEFMDEREQSLGAMFSALARAGGALEPHMTSWRARGALKRYRKRVAARRDDPPTVLSALVDLMEQLKASQSEPSAAPSEGMRKSDVDEPMQRVPPSDRHAASGFDLSLARKRVASALAAIDAPPSSVDALERINKRVAEADSEEGLIAALCELGSLIEDVIRSVREDYDRFLDAVDRQLDSLLEAIGEAEKTEHIERQQRQDINDHMMSQLSAFRDDAAKATNLDALKQSISAHLEQLSNGLTRLSRADASDGATLTGQLEAMRERLAALESESAEARSQLATQREMARTDALTGIANRAGFDEYLNDLLKRWHSAPVPLALAMVDIDHFKQVNDQFGHRAGDHALTLVANIIRSRIRATDFCARFGGEEFVLVLWDVDGPTARRIAEQLRAFVESCGCNFQGQHIALTASFGVTSMVAGDTADSVIQRADEALYAAKRAGRNRVEEG